MITDTIFRGFASDNTSWVDPQILKAIEKANIGHVHSYGNDIFTEEATEIIVRMFWENANAYFVFSWMAANVLILNHLAKRWEAVICSDTAHIKVHEEECHKKLSGYEYIVVHTSDGKIQLPDLELYYQKNKRLNPKVVSITNPTEYGTVYTQEEIRGIADFAHKNWMLVHMDGARIANAAVYLWINLREISLDCWVDVLFLGGIKNGLMFWEAIVFGDKNLSKTFMSVQETLLQVGSKMRFIAVQFTAYLEENIWHKNASHSNAMAKLLEGELTRIREVVISQKVETNGVWCILPKHTIELLQKKFPFYVWNEQTSEVRLLCSFDTNKDDVSGFIGALKSLLQAKKWE